MTTSTTIALISEAVDRVATYFSSSIPTVSEKMDYFSAICEEYAEKPAMFISVMQTELLSKHRDLYRSVWPLVEYK